MALNPFYDKTLNLVIMAKWTRPTKQLVRGSEPMSDVSEAVLPLGKGARHLSPINVSLG